MYTDVKEYSVCQHAFHLQGRKVKRQVNRFFLVLLQGTALPVRNACLHLRLFFLITYSQLYLCWLCWGQIMPQAFSMALNDITLFPTQTLSQ